MLQEEETLNHDPDYWLYNLKQSIEDIENKINDGVMRKQDAQTLYSASAMLVILAGKLGD